MAVEEGLCTGEKAPEANLKLKSLPKVVAEMRKGPEPIRVALLLLALLVLGAKGDPDGKGGITCVGREPGYYADPGSQCHRWDHHIDHN